MHRFAARIGSAFAILVLLATTVVRADTVSYAFGRSSLAFSHLVQTAGGTAVGINDPALRSLLKSLGASLTWHAGDRDVLIATSSPEVVSFAVGDPHYSVGALTAQAAFAPYVSGTEVFVPFDDLMRALGIAPQRDGKTGVLERLITAVDVQGFGLQAVLVARGAGVLRPRIVSDTSERVVYTFDGVGTTLAPTRTINAGGIRTMEITSSGTARDPQTTIELDLAPNTRHDALQAGSGEFEVAFGGNGSAPPLVEPLAAAVPPETASAQVNAAPAPPAEIVAQGGSPSPAVEPSASPSAAAGASVTGVNVQANADGSQTVSIAVTGNAAYEWHRLRAPDNRFWIDITGAQLLNGPQDQAQGNPLISMRVRQTDAQTVRVALSLVGDNELAVSPSATGITINVGTTTVADAPRSGQGTIGAVLSTNEPQTLVTPVPPDEYGAGSEDENNWKFGGAHNGYAPANPKLIVLDPGHGGSDRGASRADLQEGVLNLDLAKRVRALLIARGWQVQLTRDTDVDVFAANDSAHDELQARDNIANQAGARLFVSIHCNSYINSGPSGTTVYYSKPSDVSLAQIMDHDLAMGGLDTKDDGIVKSHLYVTLHANMPAVLIETAFLSNPSDYAKLTSPDWRQKVAEAIANGIDQYAQQNPVAGSAQ
jgi:N-acetylmuramoyl-L-alanine amidase